MSDDSPKKVDVFTVVAAVTGTVVSIATVPELAPFILLFSGWFIVHKLSGGKG